MDDHVLVVLLLHDVAIVTLFESLHALRQILGRASSGGFKVNFIFTPIVLILLILIEYFDCISKVDIFGVLAHRSGSLTNRCHHSSGLLSLLIE